MAKLKARERDSIIQALRAGVVPKLGLRHIQVGRANEIKELVKDLERISEGGAAIRFIIGDYGSGKTFFMNLIRLAALQKGFVVMFADLAPNRRLHATGGQARGLYAELTRNLSTRTKPDGGALPSVVERFVTTAQREATKRDQNTGNIIREKLSYFEELTGGFGFSEAVHRYWESYDTDNEELKTSSLRWLRGEFTTRTDSRMALGIRDIIDDANIYDHLKIMSLFVREAGYKGLLVGIDEMVNLFKLTSSQARKSNYEQILRILNDVLQGSAKNLGFLMGGTPEFLMNTRRGLYSYEALQSRLVQNPFARDGLIDLSGPVIKLNNLTPEELFVLLENLRTVVLGEKNNLPKIALESFMNHCAKRIGDAYFRTPRNTVTEFINLLAVLEQNSNVEWHDLIEKIEIKEDHGEDLDDVDDINTPDIEGNEDLVSFRL